MSMSVNRGAASPRVEHSKPANFGRLNSAIARGDLTAAEAALAAINASDKASAMAVKARGSLEAVGAAIGTGDLAATRSALAEFRKGRAAAAEAPAVPVPGTPAETPAAAPVAMPVPDVVTAVPPPAEEVIALITGSEPVDKRLA